jgi:hypothetical protein
MTAATKKNGAVTTFLSSFLEEARSLDRAIVTVLQD